MQSFFDALIQAFAGLEWAVGAVSSSAEVPGFPGYSVTLNFTYWGRNQARLIARVRTHRATEGAVNLLCHLSSVLAVVLLEEQRELECSRFMIDPSGRFDPANELVAYAVFTLDAEGDDWSRVIVDNRKVPFNPVYRAHLVFARELVPSASEP